MRVYFLCLSPTLHLRALAVVEPSSTTYQVPHNAVTLYHAHTGKKTMQ